MPIHLPPLSRRRFLASSAAAAAGLVLPGGRASWAAAADAAGGGMPVDPDRLALLSDIHVAADPATVNRKVNMADHLAAAVRAALAGPARPAGLLVNGDLAYNAGLPGDYATVLAGLAPVRAAGVPVHLTLGNHDDRANFFRALPPADPARPTTVPAPMPPALPPATNPAAAAAAATQPVSEPSPMRCVSVVRTARADLLVLDSLETTRATPGLLGGPQLKWLADALDARADRPCVVFVHHDPLDPKKPKVSGLKDTAALMDVLVPRRQAKVLLFGHSHKWARWQVEGLHLVNLPAVSYVFDDAQPSGWVDCALRDNGARLTLHGTGPKHAAHGEVVDLAWRA